MKKRSLKREAISYAVYIVIAIFLFWNAPEVINRVPVAGFGMLFLAFILAFYVLVSIVVRIVYANIVASVIKEEYPDTDLDWTDCLYVPVLRRSQIKKRIKMHQDDPTVFSSLIETLELNHEI